MKQDIKLVLSGSGTVFYIFFGAYQRIYESYNIKEIVGTSGGAIIASLIALGYSIEDISYILSEIELQKLADWSWNPFYRFGLLSGDKLSEVFKKYLDKKFSETKIPLTIVVTNLKQNKAIYYSTEKTPDMKISEVLRASISIPLLFKYVKINNEICVDGGVLHNFAVDLNKTNLKTIGLKLNSEPVPYLEQNFNILDIASLFKALFNYLLSIIRLMMNALEKKHIEDALYTSIIEIPCNFDSISFNHTKKDVAKMTLDGYNSVNDFLKD